MYLVNAWDQRIDERSGGEMREGRVSPKLSEFHFLAEEGPQRRCCCCVYFRVAEFSLKTSQAFKALEH